MIDERAERWISWPSLSLATLAALSKRRPAGLPAAIQRPLGWLWWHFWSDPTGRVRPVTLALSGISGAVLTIVLAASALSGALLTNDLAAADEGAEGGKATAKPPRSTTTKAPKPRTASGAAGRSSKTGTSGSARLAVVSVPPTYLKLYREAAKTCDMRWEVLAAVGQIETHHGSLDAPGVRSGSNGAGAQGPMQFLPATWAAYGADGNGDGKPNVYEPADAVHGAAKYLCANGAGDANRLDSALWHYNHSDAYVREVQRIADSYRGDAYVLPLPEGAVPAEAYGRSHHDYPALDVSVATGTQVLAVRGGRVHVLDDGRCGRGVVIDGTDGVRYTYCHGSKITVANNSTVATGAPIMLSGGAAGSPGAGSSSGAHLHLEIEVGGNGGDALRCPQPLMQAWSEGRFVRSTDAPRSGCTH